MRTRWITGSGSWCFSFSRRKTRWLQTPATAIITAVRWLKVVGTVWAVNVPFRMDHPLGWVALQREKQGNSPLDAGTIVARSAGQI